MQFRIKTKLILIISTIILGITILSPFTFHLSPTAYAVGLSPIATGGDVLPGSKNPDAGGQILQHIVPYVIQISSGIIGLISMFFLVFGGIKYITALGKEEQLKSANKMMFAAAIGLVLSTSAYIIVQIVMNLIK